MRYVLGSGFEIGWRHSGCGSRSPLENYLNVHADGVLICEAYPKRRTDGTTYRIRTADLTLGLDQRRLFESLEAGAKHVRFCVGNSSRRASYLRKEAGVDNLMLPSKFEVSRPNVPMAHPPLSWPASY